MSKEMLNQEGVEELQKRADSFLKKYKELVDECKIDLASYPVWVPDGQGGFKCIVQSTPVDTTNQPTKSPFVAEDKK